MPVGRFGEVVRLFTQINSHIGISLRLYAWRGADFYSQRVWKAGASGAGLRFPRGSNSIENQLAPFYALQTPERYALWLLQEGHLMIFTFRRQGDAAGISTHMKAPALIFERTHWANFFTLRRICN